MGQPERVSTAMELVKPAREHLESYCAALASGWSPDNTRAERAQEELALIAQDADGFLASLDDRGAAGAMVTLPDGTKAPRLPGFRLWMWDGDFCGSIGLRWAAGTSALPPHVLGHIGYTVVPWKRRNGYATKALAGMLARARTIEGLDYVELTTEPDNTISQRVIEANGGVFVERFNKGPSYGNKESFRFRIMF